MAIATEKLNDLNLLVKIELNPEEYKPAVDKSVKDYSRKVNLKGFRAGMVPAGVVKKMFGKEILAEQLNTLVNESLTNYIKEQELRILGDPLPKPSDEEQNLDINANTPYHFTFELGIQPDVDLNFLDKQPTLTRNPIKVDEALLDKEVSHTQKRYGTVSNPGKVEDPEHDVLQVLLEELDENGDVKEGGVQNEPAIPLDTFSGKSLLKQLKEAKVGDVVELGDIYKNLDLSQEEVQEKILELGEAAAHAGKRFRMTIKGITHVIPAPVDQKLFDKIYGEGNVTTEAEFRQKLKEELELLFESYTNRHLDNEITKYLTENVKVELPEDFLKRWLQYTNENKLADEELEEEFDPFVRNLKWTLIVNKVVSDNHIHVHKEDIEAHTQAMIAREYGFTADDEMGKHYLNELTTHFLKNKEHVERVYDQLRDRKVYEVLRTKFSYKDKPVTFEQFKELNKS